MYEEGGVVANTENDKRQQFAEEIVGTAVYSDSVIIVTTPILGGC